MPSFIVSYQSVGGKDMLYTLLVALTKTDLYEHPPDVLGGVDDLLDAGHTQGDVHGGYSSEVEGLEGHLRARLPNALGTEGPHRRAWLHLSPAQGTNHTGHQEVILQRPCENKMICVVWCVSFLMNTISIDYLDIAPRLILPIRTQ